MEERLNDDPCLGHDQLGPGRRGQATMRRKSGQSGESG